MKVPRPQLIAVFAALAAFSGAVAAQGFASVSSGPPTQEAHPAPATAAGEAAKVVEPSAPTPAPFTSLSNPAPAEKVAVAESPATCEGANPYLTGSAATDAERACAATNPFLTGSALDAAAASGTMTGPVVPTLATGTATGGATAAAARDATQAEPASVTVPFGVPHDEAVARTPLELQSADRVLVKKGERRLYLLRSNQVIAEYPIRLGLNPHGPKVKQGDFRTPEGNYQLVRRNSHSDFFLSVEVSYPNEGDIARARAEGVEPGGSIMIHGQPNTPRKPQAYYATNDWTDGCIAVSNADMVDIWLRTGIGTPVEIRP